VSQDKVSQDKISQDKMSQDKMSQDKMSQDKMSQIEISDLEKRVPLYIITATYPRLEQLAELTRLGQTLKVKKPLYVITFGTILQCDYINQMMTINVDFYYTIVCKLGQKNNKNKHLIILTLNTKSNNTV
jgi:hypothetical protein